MDETREVDSRDASETRRWAATDFAGSGSVVAALELSHLGSLPERGKERLLADANLLQLPAGGQLHREGDAVAHLQLIVSGLLRVYVTALDGRTLTVRYCRPGSILGAVSLFSSPFSMPASVQAVTDAEVLSMSASAVQAAADSDVTVARALIDELSDRVMSFIAEIPGSAFTTVRQRVARHLLDLATVTQQRGDLRAMVSQQALADSVGTVREVIVRVLRDMRDEGVVETGTAGIALLDPVQLASEAYPGPGGTDVPSH